MAAALVCREIPKNMAATNFLKRNLRLHKRYRLSRWCGEGPVLTSPFAIRGKWHPGPNSDAAPTRYII
jgi:hypothetical protein